MLDPMDARVRTAAFEWLADRVARQGDVLPRSVLAGGFLLDGARFPLVGPQGIFKPQVLRGAPLSITTAPAGPYDDSFGPDGFLRYRYRGTDPQHSDNRGLRLAMERRLPLIYFHGIVPGKYLAAWPVLVVADDPAGLAFSVAVDDATHLGLQPVVAQNGVHEDADSPRRVYVTAAVRVRLHQRAFRERVLEAYRRQCAFCSLRHEELLDAAHIVPDTEPAGGALVRNGLALCTLHHAPSIVTSWDSAQITCSRCARISLRSMTGLRWFTRSKGFMVPGSSCHASRIYNQRGNWWKSATNAFGMVV